MKVTKQQLKKFKDAANKISDAAHLIDAAFSAVQVRDVNNLAARLTGIESEILAVMAELERRSSK